MSARVAFTIAGEPRAALLSRLLGFFAQHDLASPELKVTRAGEEMIVHLVCADLGEQLARTVYGKMASLVGVRYVDLAVSGEAADRSAELVL